MTRFVVDVSAVLHLAGEGVEVSDTHELQGPGASAYPALPPTWRHTPTAPAATPAAC
jgi:hypothetical protein